MTRIWPLLVRLAAAGCLATSGIIHLQLYLNGYRAIPGIGPSFLLQACGCLAVALPLLVTSRAVLRLAAAALTAGALVGFILSRTIGVLGFVEYGLQPAPQALISVLVEIAALGLLAVPFRSAPIVGSADGHTTTRPGISPSRYVPKSLKK